VAELWTPHRVGADRKNVVAPNCERVKYNSSPDWGPKPTTATGYPQGESKRADSILGVARPRPPSTRPL
jgi:hypothetical protein